MLGAPARDCRFKRSTLADSRLGSAVLAVCLSPGFHPKPAAKSFQTAYFVGLGNISNL
jgi:hypothetical protein